MVTTGIGWRRPDKTGHFRTLVLCRLPMAALTEKTPEGGTVNLKSERAAEREL